MIDLCSETNRPIPIAKHKLIDDEKYCESFDKLLGKFFRNCKRDGNCLYRAISFLIIPKLKDEQFKKTFFSFREAFEQTGFSSSIYDWYMESIEEIEIAEDGDNGVEEYNKRAGTCNDRECGNYNHQKSFCDDYDGDHNPANNYTRESESDDETDNNDFILLISYLRMVCSAEAQQKKEFYQNFLEEDLSVYCKNKIDPLEQRAGDFEIAVLAGALKMKIKVISITQTDKIEEITYGEEGNEHLILHTPDHFEPLYNTEDLLE